LSPRRSGREFRRRSMAVPQAWLLIMWAERARTWHTASRPSPTPRARPELPGQCRRRPREARSARLADRWRGKGRRSRS
jgi:hypothetical protein